MKNEKSDIDLWNSIRNGDCHAYNKLYDRYADMLFTFGIQYTNDEALVEDSIHDKIRVSFTRHKGISPVTLRFELSNALVKYGVFHNKNNKLKKYFYQK